MIESWIKRQEITEGLAYSLIRREKETNKNKVRNRYKKCLGCKFNEKGLCKACGCIIKVKVTSRTSLNKDLNRVEITHCPKAFWVGEEEVTNLYFLTNSK